MADITFGEDERAAFPTKYHGEITLSKAKWDIICSQPERFYYRLNGEKVPTTLINPDIVRYHKTEPNQVLYYKKFDTCKMTDKVEGRVRCKFWAVIVDTSTKRVCTVYPTERPKPGKEYKVGG